MKHIVGRTYYIVRFNGKFCYASIFDKGDWDYKTFADFKKAHEGAGYTYEKVGARTYREYAAMESQHESDSINADYERYGEWIGR